MLLIVPGMAGASMADLNKYPIDYFTCKSLGLGRSSYNNLVESTDYGVRALVVYGDATGLSDRVWTIITLHDNPKGQPNMANVTQDDLNLDKIKEQFPQKAGWRIIEDKPDKSGAPNEYSRVVMVQNDQTHVIYGQKYLFVGNEEAIITVQYNDQNQAYIDEQIAILETFIRGLWPKSSQIMLTHYSAFSKEALSHDVGVPRLGIAATFYGHDGGDLAATVKNSDGSPVKNKNVYFFMIDNPGVDNNNAINLPNNYEPLDSRLKSSYPQFGTSYWGRYAVVQTDEFGNATFNYIKADCINYESLGKAIDDHGKISYDAYAITFDVDPFGTWGQPVHIENMAHVTVEYTSVAVAQNLYYKKPWLAIHDLKGDVFVIKANMYNPDQRLIDQYQKKVPITEGLYGVQPGDVILLGNNSCVRVDWISGERLYMWPKDDFLASGPKYGVFQVGSKDMGLYNRIRLSSITSAGIKTFEVLHWTHAGVGMLIEVSATPVVIALAITGTLYLAESAAEPYDVAVEHVDEELLIDPHSSFLVDFGNNATVSTLEGTATVYDKNGNFVNVTTGHTVNVSVNGTTYPLTLFGKDKLSGDLQDLVNTAQADSSSNELPANSHPTTVSYGQPNILPTNFVSVCPCASMIIAILLVTLIAYYSRR